MHKKLSANRSIMTCHESRPLIGWFKKGAWPCMHLSLRWGGGGGCHQGQGQMSNVKGQRSGHLIRRSLGAQWPEVEAGSSPEVEGLPECIGRWRHTVTSHLLEATPGDQTGRWRHVSLASSNVRHQVAQRSGNVIPPPLSWRHTF